MGSYPVLEKSVCLQTLLARMQLKCDLLPLLGDDSVCALALLLACITFVNYLAVAAQQPLCIMSHELQMDSISQQ